MPAGNEPYACDGNIEFCATTDVFPKDSNFITETPYIIFGVVLISDLIIAIGYYFGRMAWRSLSTGTHAATHWVDVTTCIAMVMYFLLLIAPFLVWPFHWVKSETLDWVIAWIFINMIGEAFPALIFIFFFWYLIVAIGSGWGQETLCVVEGTSTICQYNKAYVSLVDGWVTWTVYTLLAAVSYWAIFWFGADAVRYLRPDGGYDLYYLWPSMIYELLVITGAAPDTPRSLTGYQDLFQPWKNEDIDDTSDQNKVVDPADDNADGKDDQAAENNEPDNTTPEKDEDTKPPPTWDIPEEILLIDF